MKGNLLYIYPSFSTFVKKDYELINKNFFVKKHQYKQKKNLIGHFVNQVKLFFWLTLNIWTAKKIFIWFADYHSFLPILFAKIFRIESFIVIGGYDVAHIPEINYGSFKNPLRAKLSKFSLENATVNLPVAESLFSDLEIRAPKATGVTLHTGYDKNKFSMKVKEKEKIVLTIGSGNTIQRLKLKGIDFFIEVARLLPEYKFFIVGLGDFSKQVFNEIPENVKIFGFIDGDELIKLYSRSKVYTQFSMREGLPNVVCEAMLCECVPVGFSNGGIPIAMGSEGYLVEEKNSELAANAIKKAMNSDKSAGQSAREHIIKNFPIEKREKKLLNLLKHGYKKETNN